MDFSDYNEEVQKQHIAALLDVGKKLANAPSSVDELLSLLTQAEYLLSHVPQNCPCHKVKSVQDAACPAMHALISKKIFKHRVLDIQVAVAGCMNEIVRITIPNYPYSDAQMKDIFGLLMVAFKQLSCGSGKNFLRALRILEVMANTQSCLIMLDLEVQMGTVVVEMFRLFLEIIKPHHSADIFNHMSTIMTVIVLQDEFSKELPKTLLSSVRMDNKDTSPRSWELGKSVIEKCATVLKKHVRQAVKENKLKVADYADIVASLCQDAPTGNLMSLTKKDAPTGNHTVTSERVEPFQFVATDASGSGVSKLDERAQIEQGMQERRKIKPNSLMRPEEGYNHARLGGGRSFSQEVESSMSKKKGSKKGKKRSNSVVRCNTIGEGNTKTSKVNENEIISEKHESGVVSHKVVESSMPTPTAEQSKTKEKGLNESKEATKSVVLSDTLHAQKETVGHSGIDSQRDDGNDINSQKHEKYEARNVADKVVESAMSSEAEYAGDSVSEMEKELVNLRIMVWWPLDQTYYTGTVASYDRATKKHKIKYDDGDEEILDMSVERWELVNERQSQQVAQLGERKAGTAPAKEPANCSTLKKRTKSKAGSSKKGSAAAGPSS